VKGPEALTIRLHPTDNVVVAQFELGTGATLPGEDVVCLSVIPPSHKVATAAIAAGEPVRKYGQIIGFATKDISPGEHLHVHNLEVRDFSRDYSFGSEVRPTEFVDAAARATFDGIVRADGRIGTRNHIGIVPTVNCSNTVARPIADAFAGTATNGAEMNNNPTPGYDPVSITGMVAGGANMVCFTTGRGSVYGCKPVPCLKLATNSPMYRRMADDMDVNCGAIDDAPPRRRAAGGPRVQDPKLADAAVGVVDDDVVVAFQQLFDLPGWQTIRCRPRGRLADSFEPVHRKTGSRGQGVDLAPEILVGVLRRGQSRPGEPHQDQQGTDRSEATPVHRCFSPGIFRGAD
jgi:hypothetical protein